MQVEPAPRFIRIFPVGYQYLLPMIAHDLVESSLFFVTQSSSILGLSNVRARPLRLRQYLAAAPSPMSYAYDERSGFRERLRQGRREKGMRCLVMTSGEIAAPASATETVLNQYPERSSQTHGTDSMPFRRKWW